MQKKARSVRGVAKKRVSVVHTKEPKRVKLWAYGYEGLAALFGESVDLVRHWAVRAKFRPGELESVCRFWAERNKERLLMEWAEKERCAARKDSSAGSTCDRDSAASADTTS